MNDPLSKSNPFFYQPLSSSVKILIMAAPLHLRLVSLEDDEPWIVEQKYFIILNDYLQPDSEISAAAAAARINELTPMKRKPNGEEAEHPESWCLEFWGTISETVKQIPYGHPSQDKTVEIIKELKALPGVEVEFYETTFGFQLSCLDRRLTFLSFCIGNNPNLDRSSIFDGSMEGGLHP